MSVGTNGLTNVRWLTEILLAAALVIAAVLGLFWAAGIARAETLGCFVVDRYANICVQGSSEMFVEMAHQKLAADGWMDRTQNKWGQRCCDAGKDCHPVAPERVMSHRDGVLLPDYGDTVIPGRDIMPSEDGHYWICVWGGRVRCFFAPWNGS